MKILKHSATYKLMWGASLMDVGLSEILISSFRLIPANECKQMSFSCNFLQYSQNDPPSI